MVPRECAFRATVVADPALGSTAQLHRGTSRATPPTYTRDQIRARAALLHRPSANARDSYGSERRDDANVVRERAVRGGLRDGPGGGGRG